jgi:acyl transferase domain-containing protein
MTVPVEPIAIIGMGCRLPGAPHPAAFWNLLRNGVDAVREVPPDRWLAADWSDDDVDAPGRMLTRQGGFIDGIQDFDTAFFGISRREAIKMDPQQRLALELVWEALEDAGLIPAELAGSRTGVYCGFGMPEYGLPQLAHPPLIDAYTNTGIAGCILANRISYLFDFRGPSFAMDSACSTSLVATHLACQALRYGDADLAITGAVSLIVAPVTSIGMSKMFALAANGRCKFMDANADGYGRGEGGGVLVLKRLKDAQADGDRIRAVILGDAINQDGRSNGLTAPNPAAQVAVLKEAYERAGVAPADVQYIEAHGTGTLLGDPIEANALAAVLSEDRPAERQCRIGSVKTNIGHLEGAAGFAGIMKVVLSLEHQQLPPSLNCRKPTPMVAWDRIPLVLQTTLGPWPDPSRPLIAGISGFGFGGTNGHVVLTAAPASCTLAPVRGGEGASVADLPLALTLSPADEVTAGNAQLLTISARSEAALKELTQRYLSELSEGGSLHDASLYDFCANVAIHRTHHDYRIAIIADSRGLLIERLQSLVAGNTPPGCWTGRRPQNRPVRVAFEFPESQWTVSPAEWEQLLAEPAFVEAWRDCEQFFVETTKDPLPAPVSPSADPAAANPWMKLSTQLGVQYALARLWHAWGIVPVSAVGHGLGRTPALRVSAEFALPDAFPRSGSAAAKKAAPPDFVLLLGGSDASPVEPQTTRRLSFGKEADVPNTPVRQQMLACLAELYVGGCSIDARQLFPHAYRRMSLPTYPFQRERLWLDTPFPYHATDIAEAKQSGVEQSALTVGATAPDFELITRTKQRFCLSEAVRNGPVLLVWYRGSWCPYCRVTLRRLHRELTQINRLGATAVAICPERADASLAALDLQRTQLPFLVDADNAVGRAFGVVFPVTGETVERYRRQFAIDLEHVNGNGAPHTTPELPTPAAFIIDQQQSIRFASCDADYTRQPDLDKILAALEQLQTER